jgi:parallel beta-helix repeat protein
MECTGLLRAGAASLQGVLSMTAPNTGKSRSRCLRLELLEGREVPSTTVHAPMHRVLEVHQANPHATYQTIQSAVNAANPGDEIRIFSGTYSEAVTVKTANLKIDAASGATVIIQNPGKADNGIAVHSATGGRLTGFTLAGVKIEGFQENGVYLIGVDHFEISHVVTANDAGYGIYPVLSSHGSIHDSRAYGSNDSGIYVGQSHDVTINNNVAYDNVNGIEIENSTRVSASNNTAFDNTVGILVDQLPGAIVAIGYYSPVENSSYNVVQYNHVFANNRPNSAPSDDIASAEPSGAGIVIIGGDHTRVQGNSIFANGYVGIALLSGPDLLLLAPPGTPNYSPGIDSLPESTLIQKNILSLNGFVNPPAGYPHPADLIWTYSGKNNHWRHNLYDTSTPGTLP